MVLKKFLAYHVKVSFFLRNANRLAEKLVEQQEVGCGRKLAYLNSLRYIALE